VVARPLERRLVGRRLLGRSMMLEGRKGAGL
jgi:hypothetical protein